MRFEACAHSYDEHARPQRFFAERVAEFIHSGTGILADSSDFITPLDRQDACPTTILELGAGTGALTVHLCGMKCPSIHATDASPAMVQFGRAAVPAAEWSVLDAFTEPLPRAGLQVSSGLLHWADDPSAMLHHWKSFLAPGGRMVHAMPCEPCLAEWRAIVPESPVQWGTEADWRRTFESAGLRVCRSQLWTHQMICGSALEMVQGFHRSGVTGRVRVGPGRLRLALRKYDARQRVPGGVKATWAWLAVEAVAE